MAQFAGCDVSGRVVERMLAQGILTRITRGVYATGPGGWGQLAWTGVLIGLGGTSAGPLDSAMESLRVLGLPRRSST